MTAPIMFEPSDPADLPLEVVSADRFARMVGSLGAVVELDPDGGPDVVVYNGRQYVTEARTAVAS